MAGFDELATDRRLTRARTEQHLAASAEEPSLLAGRYVCLASGGSSGLRGTFVQTIEEFAEFSASILRRLVASLAAAGPPPPGGVPVALVGAASPVHASGFAAAAAAAAIRSGRSPRRPRCRWPSSSSGSTRCGRWS